MKKISLLAIMAMAVLSACQKESDAPVSRGVELTISASVASPETDTKTTYAYSAGTQAGTITTSWEATEKITVVSIGDAGITAVDEFTSTGTAGRAKAEFSGTWTGNSGDKVICLYPAISTAAGTARYSGVTVSSTSIEVNFPAHSPSTDISTIKDYDLMIGDVSISGGTAYVEMQRKIAVLRLGISGASTYEYGVYGRYIQKIGISVINSSSMPKVFASHGAISVTKASYSGNIVPDSYYAANRNEVTQNNDGWFYYYIPLLANDSMYSGDTFTICFTDKEYSGSKWYSPADKTKNTTLTETYTFSPGYIYAINAEL